MNESGRAVGGRAGDRVWGTKEAAPLRGGPSAPQGNSSGYAASGMASTSSVSARCWCDGQ
jgi:hypothetical protein